MNLEPHVPPFVGRYELMFELASGAFGTVYLARALGPFGFEKLVALKRCHEHLKDTEFVEMFLSEARIAALIRSPNVVSTTDVIVDTPPSLVMDYVEGASLFEMLAAVQKTKRLLPEQVVLRIACDLLLGLAAAHDLRSTDGTPLGLVHRDVSPQNVLIGVDGLSRITDFGVAKANQRLSHTRPGQVKGKVAYMAPEQVTGQRVTAATDLFAAGVILWEALTGLRLFRGETEAETVNRLLRSEIPAVRSIRSDLDPRLQPILDRALARDPKDRYQRAAELEADLEELRPASPRTVSMLIEEVFAERIAERRGRLQAILQSKARSTIGDAHFGTRQEQPPERLSTALERSWDQAMTEKAPSPAQRSSLAILAAGQLLHDGARVRIGEPVQIVCIGTPAPHGVVISLDEGRRVTLHFPSGGAQAAPLPLATEVCFSEEGSFQLLIVTSTRPFAVDSVVSEAGAATPSLPQGLRQTSLLLRSVAG
jgi:serine/threonine-protein kinase